MGIDQLVRYRRTVDQNAEPAERIDAFESANRISRNALSRHAMVAVAASDEIARDFMRGPVFHVPNLRTLAVEIMQRHLVRLIDGFPSRRVTRIHEIVGDLGLPVDHHMSADELAKIESVTVAVEAKLDSVMDQSFGMHAGAYSGVDRAARRCLVRARPHECDRARNRAAAFKDDGFDSLIFKEPTKQEAGGSGSDDRDLNTHPALP